MSVARDLRLGIPLALAAERDLKVSLVGDRNKREGSARSAG